MPSQRITRVNELLRRELGQLLYRELQNESVDFSTLTVTHVDTSPDLRNSTVLVSIRGSEDEQQEMLNILKRHRKHIQQVMSKAVILKYTPHLTFKLDTSIAEGDAVLEMLDNLPVSPDEEAEYETPDEFDAS